MAQFECMTSVLQMTMTNYPHTHTLDESDQLSHAHTLDESREGLKRVPRTFVMQNLEIMNSYVAS